MKRFLLASIGIFTFLILIFSNNPTFAKKDIEDCTKECLDPEVKKQHEDTQSCVCSCLHKSCLEECASRSEVGMQSQECTDKCKQDYNSCIGNGDQREVTEQEKPETEQTKPEDLSDETKQIIEQQVKEKLQIDTPKDTDLPRNPENPIDIEFKY